MRKPPKFITAKELQEQMEADPDNLTLRCWNWCSSEKEKERISNIARKLAEVSDMFKLWEDVDDLLLVAFTFVETHLEERPREMQKEILNCLADKLNFVFHIEDLEEYND